MRLPRHAAQRPERLSESTALAGASAAPPRRRCTGTHPAAVLPCMPQRRWLEACQSIEQPGHRAPVSAHGGLLPPPRLTPTAPAAGGALKATPTAAVQAGPHDAALQPRGRRRAATGAKPPAPPPHNGVLQHDAAAGSPKNGGCKAPPVVLTSGPGLRLHLPDIIAVCRQGRRVQLDPSPAFAARIAAGPRALARTLAAGVRVVASAAPRAALHLQCMAAAPPQPIEPAGSHATSQDRQQPPTLPDRFGLTLLLPFPLAAGSRVRREYGVRRQRLPGYPRGGGGAPPGQPVRAAGSLAASLPVCPPACLPAGATLPTQQRLQTAALATYLPTAPL